MLLFCASAPFSPSNVPNQGANVPFPSSNVPFRRSNVRIHTSLVNSSPLLLLKSLEESAGGEQFSLLGECPVSALECPIWTGE